MFYTPSITEVRKQSNIMNLPLITQNTKGKKEEELNDLENAIKIAKKEYIIEAVVT